MSKEQLEAMRRAVRAARFVPIDYEALKKIQPTPPPKKKNVFVYNSNFRYPSGTYEDDEFFYFVTNEGFMQSYSCTIERKMVAKDTVAEVVIADVIAQYIEVDFSLPLFPYKEDFIQAPEIVMVIKKKNRIKLDIHRVFMPFPNYLWEHREIKIDNKLPPRGCIQRCKYIFPRLNCQKNPTQNLETFLEIFPMPHFLTVILCISYILADFKLSVRPPEKD